MMVKYKCTHGHDRCFQMSAGPECPTCERVATPPEREAREELRLKLRSIAASAQDAQDYFDDLENLGELLEDMQGDLNRALVLAERL